MARYHDFVQVAGTRVEILDILSQQAEYALQKIETQTKDPFIILNTYKMWLSRFMEERAPIVKEGIKHADE